MPGVYFSLSGRGSVSRSQLGDRWANGPYTAGVWLTSLAQPPSFSSVDKCLVYISHFLDGDLFRGGQLRGRSPFGPSARPRSRLFDYKCLVYISHFLDGDLFREVSWEIDGQMGPMGAGVWLVSPHPRGTEMSWAVRPHQSRGLGLFARPSADLHKWLMYVPHVPDLFWVLGNDSSRAPLPFRTSHCKTSHLEVLQGSPLRSGPERRCGFQTDVPNHENTGTFEGVPAEQKGQLEAKNSPAVAKIRASMAVKALFARVSA